MKTYESFLFNKNYMVYFQINIHGEVRHNSYIIKKVKGEEIEETFKHKFDHKILNIDNDVTYTINSIEKTEIDPKIYNDNFYISGSNCNEMYKSFEYKDMDRLKDILKDALDRSISSLFMYLFSFRHAYYLDIDIDMFDLVFNKLSPLDRKELINDSSHIKETIESNKIYLLDHIVKLGFKFERPGILSKTDNKDIIEHIRSYDFQKMFIEYQPENINNFPNEWLNDDIKKDYEYIFDTKDLGLL